MQFKKIALATLTAGLLWGLSAPTQAAGKALRFGHDNKADVFDNPAHACAGVFQNIVNADTNGEIEVKIFGSNQLGSAKEHIQQVRDGILQATLSSTGAISGFYPRIDVLNLAFAFDNNGATYDVFDGDFGKSLARDIEAEMGDVVVLGFPDTGGFFAVTNSKHRIEKLEDFEGIRIRTMTLPSHQKIIQSLGGEAYPLAWGEVYSSLQTGVIDGQMNPVPIISFAKFAEVQKYMTLTNHLFSPYTFILNKDFWQGLSPEQQKVLGYAAKSCVTASRGISRAIEASDRGLSGLMKKIEVTALTAENREAFKAVSQPAVAKHVEETLGAKGIELLQQFEEAVSKANADKYLQQ